jgi:hypothetical protein
MAGTYGTRDATQFLLPSVESNEKYYTIVERDTGKITLKRIVPLSFNESLDATVGTIETSGTNAGKFIPGAGASATEKQAFSQQPQAVKTVKDKATETVTRAKVKEGTNQQAAQTEANKLLSPNTASSTESGDSQAGEQAEGDQFNEGEAVLTNITSQIKDSVETRKVEQYPSDRLLTYPFRLKTAEQDSVRFTMLKYAPKKASIPGISRGEPFEKREGQETRRGSTVILPIQSGISDSNSVAWNRDDMDASQAIAAVAALAGIKEGGQGLISSLKSGMDLLKTENANIKEAIAAYFAQEATGVKGLLARTTGGIVNTNTELLFNGPELRTFTFNIVMSARDSDESKNIRNIIRFFKQGMSVKRSSSGLFLKSPHTFQIKYYYKETENHPWINQIKECALTNCSVNYTPAQTYSTYDDGAMTMYEMTLQFAELEPIYDDDYNNLVPGGNSDTHIGF